MIKKYISAALAAAVLLSTSGCGGSGGGDGADTEKLRIVTTVFPEYDWVKEILGDKAGNAEITLLTDSGVDMHSYQPTVDDILAISDCDLFVYVGGESDAWAEDALNGAEDRDVKAISLLDALGDGVKEEETVEGMESDEDEADEASEADAHVWLSLKNAKALCGVIADALGEIDTENAAVYTANAAEYGQRLDLLDEEYREAVSSAKHDTLVFCDRFPFRYMTDDYGLKYYAAFSGCSAETEASFETITFLAEKLDELKLNTVITIEKSDQRVAKTVADNVGVESIRILTMDSMQSVTADDIGNGAAYLSVMEKNLDVLKDALN